jgi:hypothetical protein
MLAAIRPSEIRPVDPFRGRQPPLGARTMPHVHLPAHHRDEDLALAGALATLFESDELYVAWSLKGGPGEPIVAARLHEPEPPALELRPAPSRPWAAAWSRLVRRLGGPGPQRAA